MGPALCSLVSGPQSKITRPTAFQFLGFIVSLVHRLLFEICRVGAIDFCLVFFLFVCLFVYLFGGMSRMRNGRLVHSMLLD